MLLVDVRLYSDAFGKAFDCTKGHPMMPTDACRVW
jgi:hypothetical protein